MNRTLALLAAAACWTSAAPAQVTSMPLDKPPPTPSAAPTTIALRPAAADRVDARAGFWLSIVLAASAAAFVPIAARALERRPLLAWAGLGALPTAAWLGVDPLPLVGALGLFLAGRSIGR